MLALLVLAIGLAAGFLSGLVGLGGGILAAPLLLYVPGVAGLDEFTVKEVTGLTMVQGLAGALSGLTRHQSYGFVSWRLVGKVWRAWRNSAVWASDPPSRVRFRNRSAITCDVVIRW